VTLFQQVTVIQLNMLTTSPNDGDEDEDMHEDNGIQELKYFCLVFSSQALLTQPSPVTVIYLHLPLLPIINGPTLPTRSTLRYIKLRMLRVVF